APANGASLAQPITISWSASTASSPIIYYNWQVATTSAFAAAVSWGVSPDTPGAPLTQAKVGGLPNGIYFCRAQAAEQGVLANPPRAGAWSAPATFTVTGLGAAPAAPVVSGPADGAAFHPLESFFVTWSLVAGATHYLLEVSNLSAFTNAAT